MRWEANNEISVISLKISFGSSSCLITLLNEKCYHLLTMWSLWMWIVTFQATRSTEYASPLCCCAWMEFCGCDWCIFRSGSLCDPLPHGSPARVSEHADNNGHRPLWNEVKFIDRDPQFCTRKVKEAIYIRLHLNSINRDNGIEILEAWMPTIKKQQQESRAAADAPWNSIQSQLRKTACK